MLANRVGARLYSRALELRPLPHPVAGRGRGNLLPRIGWNHLPFMQQARARWTKDSPDGSRGNQALARGRRVNQPHRRGSPVAPAIAARIPRGSPERRPTAARVRGLGTRTVVRGVIVGTAGHIDHGKTTLIRALTGIDTDRLPEEKRRGITIDLGFAELTLGDTTIGFIDVPGHQRFVKNMLAGAHGMDLVMLVVAADESVMPQTREHFEICRMLGVGSGLIVITKSDSVDDELLGLVREEAADLVKGSFLEQAPIVSVSARTSAGIDVLRETLSRLAASVPPRPADLVPRLPIDRSFTVKGFGTVATGTLLSGSINEASVLELLPAGTRVRVRGIQVQGNPVSEAVAGQRTAVNLGGLDAGEVERGMVLAAADSLRSTQVVNTECELIDSAPKALRSRTRVRVHLGTTEVLARIRLF